LLVNTWRNLPSKIWVTIASLDPRLRRRSREAAERLSPREAELFLAMARYDLAHSLAVAARLEDDQLLYRAALLHDAGKLRSELGIFARWLYTALELFMPRRLQRIGAAVEEETVGENVKEKIYSLPRGWKRGLYVQLHHGEIAGEILYSLGSEDELVHLVRGHQDEPVNGRARRLREIDDSL
jgi:hypothetical protein